MNPLKNDSLGLGVIVLLLLLLSLISPKPETATPSTPDNSPAKEHTHAGQFMG